MNMVPCTIEAGDGAARVRPEKHEPVAVTAKIPASAVGMKGTLGVRPENLSLANGGARRSSTAVSTSSSSSAN